MNDTDTARFQVTYVKHGYAVRDTRDNTIWTKTYVKLEWAIKAAVRLNNAHPASLGKYARRAWAQRDNESK